jgi:CDP-diacylglycerol--glycerol-3-phosphate 3-phosphatidyltransferase/CDP-diacylglycerol--inositol 3-phosphatidyltransferase
MDARGGIAERADRLVAILVLTFFGDALGLPVLYEATLWVLAVASTYTVGYRVLKVRRQALAAGPLPE